MVSVRECSIHIQTKDAGKLQEVLKRLIEVLTSDFEGAYSITVAEETEGP